MPSIQDSLDLVRAISTHGSSYSKPMNHAQTRTAAISRAQTLWARQPLFLDTETTGLHATAEIVEICILDQADQVLLDSLVKPTRSIPAGVTRIHGISNAMVRNAPTWVEIWPTVQGILAGRAVGIYNAEFDLRMMQQSHRQSGLAWQPIGAHAFCIMELYARFYPTAASGRRSPHRWQSLANAGRQCAIALPNAHRARADTRLARAILQYMARESGSTIFD